nr:hypothetical protein [Oscillochloris trichoides]
MAVDAFLSKHIPSVSDVQRRSQVIWWLMYVSLIGITGVMMSFMHTQGPSWSMVAWIIYLAGMVAIFYNPRYGVYLILFLTLMGDQAMLYWYPFIKNFSSAESLMYLNGSGQFESVRELYRINCICLVRSYGSGTQISFLCRTDPDSGDPFCGFHYLRSCVWDL